jgi:hypothetical protein
MLGKISIKLLSVILSGFFVSCAATNPDPKRSLSVSYIDDYTIPQDKKINGKIIGGLSDISFDGENFYMIVDSPSQSRFLKAKINFSQDSIESVELSKAISISKGGVYPDWEGISFQGNDKFLISSEGAIRKNELPGLLEIDSTGAVKKRFPLPDYFTLKNSRDNRLFEGIVSDKKGGFWTTTETPLKNEGSKPGFLKNSAKVRLLHYDENDAINKEQFYRLDRLRRVPYLPMAMNGVSAISVFNTKLLVLERAFYAGRGKKGFHCRLFETDITDQTVVNPNVSPEEVPVVSKKLVFDFETIRKKTEHQSIDNLEGLCLGPKLPNGNRTLWIVADNNFNRYQQQYNQILVFEIYKRKK